MPTFEPSDLTRAAGRLTELVFELMYGKVPWLLVRIGAGDAELAAALGSADATAPAAPAPGQLAFDTEVMNQTPIRIGREGDRLDPDRSSLVKSLVKSLGDDSYHVVPIQKRKDVAVVFGDRISIGRALNKDIVLRHASISKFHAYFQMGPASHCAVADAESKNGTFVNGSRIQPKDPVDVTSGDRVTFGSIATVVVDAMTLWRVLRAR